MSVFCMDGRTIDIRILSRDAEFLINESLDQILNISKNNMCPSIKILFKLSSVDCEETVRPQNEIVIDCNDMNLVC